jgi:catechol 2,3-dioxygenase-like lactoylglutathione lyase family enzyme
MIGNTLIKGIDHVAIVVGNMDRSIEFYNGVLGLKIHHDGRKEGGSRKSFLGSSREILVALTEDENRGKAGVQFVEGVAHIAFRVEDVEKASKLLKEKGVEFIEEKIDKDGKRKSYHFLDPDGLELEIYGKTGQIIPPY